MDRSLLILISFPRKRLRSRKNEMDHDLEGRPTDLWKRPNALNVEDTITDQKVAYVWSAFNNHFQYMSVQCCGFFRPPMVTLRELTMLQLMNMKLDWNTKVLWFLASLFALYSIVDALHGQILGSPWTKTPRRQTSRAGIASRVFWCYSTIHSPDCYTFII